ncbi:transcriptional regulator [Sphaerisporangium siamense]|uniref:DNA-binding transcriptional ArsR family regulator n=1 Tax=Sphaerisporangium siamense TaxID=795645 RepID=A0A7W7GA76_9ACTN|nr:helix-turn-helix domain-containing protein [Sphaerisporangium siamense]MBB4701184.1 DNA-binding transcriptional ArsR family regulator [Sphaerisporangium siamense]GII87449.1 transcriptional regulator [Sphaerisporangium siamense]
MSDPSVYHVSDPRTLKAVAHPLRVRLLGALRLEGPATATELASRFGESSGSTSYHLRQLAKYGFVEEDPEQRDARERRWRSVHRYTAWNELELGGTPEGREAAGFMRDRQFEVFVRDREGFERDRESWGPAWVEAAGMSDDMVRMTPETLRRLYERVSALVRELEAEDAGKPGAERVSVHLAAFPTRGYHG